MYYIIYYFQGEYLKIDSSCHNNDSTMNNYKNNQNNKTNICILSLDQNIITNKDIPLSDIVIGKSSK